MLSLDPSTTNIVLAVTVAGLFVFFIALLMKLNPKPETREDAKTKIEVKKQEPPQTPQIAPRRPQAEKIEAPRIADEPLVTVSPTAVGASVQTNQETLAPDFRESREIPKPEKTIVPPKTDSVSLKRDCLHHFGYLRSLPKNSPFPDECLGCERIVDCFVNKKSSAR